MIAVIGIALKEEAHECCTPQNWRVRMRTVNRLQHMPSRLKEGVANQIDGKTECFSIFSSKNYANIEYFIEI